MVRIPNDCFSDPSEMLSVEEARSLIAQSSLQLTTEEVVDLQDCIGRILAKDIYSAINVPPANNSAVDGYAFSQKDFETATNGEFINVGISAAGRPFEDTVKTGNCVKIFTGALMPDGCDTVAMIEDVTQEGDRITLPTSLNQGTNCRLAGEDIQKGGKLLSKGASLRPQELGYLASVGIGQVPVFKHLKVAVISTGDELTEPGSPLEKGGIYDSNRYILGAMLKKFGCEVRDYGIVRDSFDAIRETLMNAANETDLILTSGGVSMGDEDHVKAVVEDTGSLHFWRIAIKPGRPLALGQIAATPFVGLPGNPVAALICAIQFVRPMIAHLTGETSYTLPTPIMAKANFSMQKKRGRREWLRGRYCPSKTGDFQIEKFSVDGSGIVSSLIWANGLIELDENLTEIKQGDLIKFVPFTELYA